MVREIEVTMRIKVADEDIEDIVATAIEQGIGYWACLDNTSERYENAPEEEPVAETAAKILLEGGGVTFLDNEDRKTAWTLTLDKLLFGLKEFIGSPSMVTCIDGDMLECGQIDADAADAIVQYALFKELVYG